LLKKFYLQQYPDQFGEEEPISCHIFVRVADRPSSHLLFGEFHLPNCWWIPPLLQNAVKD